MSQIQREQIDQLKGFLQAHQLEMVALLRRLVEAESPSSDPEAQEPGLIFKGLPPFPDAEMP
jgi:hypothetical protein